MIDETTAFENYVQDTTPPRRPTKKQTRLESTIRTEIHEGLMRQGWPFCSLHGDEYLAGWPDIHFVIPIRSRVGDFIEMGRAGYIEMKREGRVSKGLQAVIQARLRRAGALVVSDCTSWAMVVAALKEEGIEVRDA